METKDHLALGRILLERAGHSGLQEHRAAFLFGCVEPDYNFITYLRGLPQYRNFCGHNAENSLSFVESSLLRLQRGGLRGARDYFTLGTALHYAADAFTWPHNRFWGKSLAEHVAYERELHGAFSDAAFTIGTAQPDSWGLLTTAAGDTPLPELYRKLHAAYAEAPHSPEADCKAIFASTQLLLTLCLRYAQEEAFRRKQERSQEAYPLGTL